MKRGRKRTNIGTQEMTNMTNPATSYSEINKGPRGVERAPHWMNGELNIVLESVEKSLSGGWRVVIHRIPEPFMKKRMLGKETAKHLAVNLL